LLANPRFWEIPSQSKFFAFDELIVVCAWILRHIIAQFAIFAVHWILFRHKCHIGGNGRWCPELWADIREVLTVARTKRQLGRYFLSGINSGWRMARAKFFRTTTEQSAHTLYMIFISERDQFGPGQQGLKFGIRVATIKFLHFLCIFAFQVISRW
jgi:hypothetical protein